LDATEPVPEISPPQSLNESPSKGPHSTNSTLSRIASASEVIADAIDCFNHIEALKVQFADSGGNVERTLNGLQKVLLEQDVRLAKLLDPRLTDLDAGKLLARLAEAAANGESIGAHDLPGLDNPIDRSTDAAPDKSLDILSEHYQKRLRSDIQGFGNVAAVVEEFVGAKNSLNSDLLKDAWSYAAASTMLQDRYDHAQRRFEFKIKEIDAVQANFPPETVEDMKKTAARVAQFFIADTEAKEAAYEAVYAWRFANVHGLDAETLAGRLETIKLPNPSPVDLSIP